MGFEISGWSGRQDADPKAVAHNLTHMQYNMELQAHPLQPDRHTYMLKKNAAAADGYPCNWSGGNDKQAVQFFKNQREQQPQTSERMCRKMFSCCHVYETAQQNHLFRGSGTKGTVETKVNCN